MVVCSYISVRAGSVGTCDACPGPENPADRSPAGYAPAVDQNDPLERGSRGLFAASHGMPPWVPRLLLQITAIVVLLWAAYQVGRALRGFLILVLISLFLSVALEPAVAYLAKRGWRRGIATGVIFVVSVQLTMLAVALMVPLVVDQTRKLISSVPGYVTQINDFLGRFDITLSRSRIVDSITTIDTSIQGLANDLGGTILGVGSRLVNTVFQILTIALFTFYFTADAPRVRRAVLRLFPPDRQRVLLRVQEIAIEKTGAYIYSRALLAAVAALATWVALRVIGVPFAEPLALWVGVLSQFVPVVGTYLGGVLPVLIALLESPAAALWVLVFIVLYQQFENYIVSPRITERTMSLHPAISFGSAIIGATLMGAPGALMALPVAATVQAWISTYIDRHEVIESHLIEEQRLGPGAPQGEAPRRGELSDEP